jgi:small multidrug resistance family-3 protein
MAILKSLSIFILAGLCEIGGGYLVWQCLKEDKPWWYGVCGGLILALYGVVATWQTNNFGRVYATYGGIFIVMALLWVLLFICRANKQQLHHHQIIIQASLQVIGLF